MFYVTNNFTQVLFCSDVKQLMGDELTACPAGVGAL